MPADVASGLPAVDLAPGSIVTVTVDDPGATVVEVRVHGWQELPPGEQVPPEPLLTLTELDAAAGP